MKTNIFKATFILIIISCFSVSSYTQHLIKGKVLDNNGRPLSYATVTLLNPQDSTLKYFGISNNKGIYQIKNIKKEKYILQYSFVGMETTYENISIPVKSGEDLGEKKMIVSLLDEVIITAEYVPIKFKHDTVEFNAKAFITKPDAVVEDLLRKIPGIEVDESGNLKALGEDVTKVLVDGKEFFGSDQKVAIKNLPASAIDKIQIYDKKSEEAEFMGIDDGVRDRTINLLLNEKNKKGYFGNVEAGIGSDDLYKTSGKIYRFSKKIQAAALGMYNNINEFGYTGGRHGGFGQQINGLNITAAGGLNLSYNSTDYNRYFISYLARSTNTILEQSTLREIFSESKSYFQDSEYEKDETNSPHSINFGVRHNFNPNNNLTLDGNANIETNDIFSQNYTVTSFNENTMSSLLNNTDNNTFNVNANAKGVYIYKFRNSKTQIKTNFSTLYEKNSSDYNWTDTTITFIPISAVSLLAQYQENKTNKFNLSANPRIVHQIKDIWFLSANVNIGLSNQNLDRIQGNPEGNIVVDSLSADFNTTNNFIKPALSLRRSAGNKQFNFILGTSWNQLNIDLPGFLNVSKSYFHFLPGFSFENSYQTGRRITLRYTSKVNMPSISQLLPVSSNLNQLSVYKGNSELIPEFNQNLRLSWSVFDQFSFTSLFSRFNFGYTKDKISLSKTINEDFTLLVIPVNVAYYYNASSMIYFSTPIRSLGLKVNVRSLESWNRGISLINNSENINTNFTHSLKVSVENRNKEKWHYNIGGSLSLTNSKFSIDKDLNNNFLNTTYFLELNYSPNKHWSFETDGNVVNYNSKSFGESFSIPLLNAGFSYYFLKGEKASVSLQGYDLLDKSTSISQTATINYLIQTESNILGRRVMLMFKMRFGR